MAEQKLVTYYDSLKVARNSPLEVIRATYRALCQKYHPDKYPDRERAERIMKILNQAYEVLSDPTRRQQHDAWIGEQEVLRAAKERQQTVQNERAAEAARQHRARASSSQSAGGQGQAQARYEPPAEPSIPTAGAFGLGYKSSTPETSTPNKLHFAQVLGMCALGGWFIAFGMVPGSADASPSALLFDAGFIGMALASTLALCGAAMVGWIVGKLIRPVRRYASWVALGVAIVVFLGLKAGEKIADQRRLPAEVLAAPTREAPNAVRQPNRAQSKVERQPNINRKEARINVDDLNVSDAEYNPMSGMFTGRIANNSPYTLHNFSVNILVFDCAPSCVVVADRALTINQLVPSGQSRDFSTSPIASLPIPDDVPIFRGTGKMQWSIIDVGAEF